MGGDLVRTEPRRAPAAVRNATWNATDRTTSSRPTTSWARSTAGRGRQNPARRCSARRCSAARNRVAPITCATRLATADPRSPIPAP